MGWVLVCIQYFVLASSFSTSMVLIFNVAIHSKKGIVILTSGLLYEFQTSAQQRAKLVCVSGVHQENTLAQ